MLSFAKDGFDYYYPSAESLFEILLMKAKEFTTKEDVRNIVADDNGAYLVTASATGHYKVNVKR